MLRGETVADEERLRLLAAEWTALADSCGRPYSLPAWALAWWRHVRPAGAELRAVLVRDGDELVAVAPFYADGSRYRLLASPLCEPVEPVAAPGREREAVAVVATELAGHEGCPRALDFGTQLSASEWVSDLRDAWPGGQPNVREGATVPMHVLSIEGEDYDGWLQSRSSKQRANLRRYRRKLDEAGAAIRISTVDTVEADVDTFLRLHVSRHEDEDTPLAGEGIGSMLVEAGHALIPDGRFRLFCVDLDGEMIGARLMLAAGGEVTAWNSGFDDAYGKLSPSLNTFAAGVALAIENGDRRIDMGPDTADHKRRLTDEECSLVSRVLLPPGRGQLLARLRLALRLGV
ncbi:MAG TPA: GNAT family N-acetyltransferase [Solirubrobacterales bacterium]